MKKEYIIFGLLVLIGVCVVSYFAFQKDTQRHSELKSEYPLLTKNDSINGVIAFLFDIKANGFRDSGSVSSMTINGRSYTIIADEIDAKSKLGINQIVSVGDSILKKAISDTLFIIKKDGSKYLFLRRDKLSE